MKRYAIFAGADYYPQGGWGDFVSAHATMAEALAAYRTTIEETIPFNPAYHKSPIRRYQWVQLVDLRLLAEVDRHETD